MNKKMIENAEKQMGHQKVDIELVKKVMKEIHTLSPEVKDVLLPLASIWSEFYRDEYRIVRTFNAERANFSLRKEVYDLGEEVRNLKKEKK